VLLFVRRYKAATPQGAKRNISETTAAKTGSTEIPKASKVTFTDTPRPVQQAPRRLPTSAPVKVCLFKITDCEWLKGSYSVRNRKRQPWHDSFGGMTQVTSGMRFKVRACHYTKYNLIIRHSARLPSS